MSATAVLVVDMLNDYRHPDAEQLAESVSTVIDPLVGLIEEANRRDDVDLIYVNDNRGDFTADYRTIISGALDGARPDLVEPVLPQSDWLSLLKVRHSVFYATSLDYLLRRLETRRLVLTGQVTEQCVLYSALDGYVRHYEVVVPPDAVAHIDANAKRNDMSDRVRAMEGDVFDVLKQMRRDRERFDIVVVDPPAFVKRRKDLAEGRLAYRRVNEAAMQLLGKDGLLVSCSCSFHFPRDMLLEALNQGARHLDRNMQVISQLQQAPDHPVHPAIPETDYLKGFIARVLLAQ